MIANSLSSSSPRQTHFPSPMPCRLSTWSSLGIRFLATYQRFCYLCRDVSFPNPLKFGGDGSLNKFAIQGFNREAARSRMGPHNCVFLLRERREEGSKTLPVFQLYRREGVAQLKVPITRRKLRDRDLRVWTVGE